ncbi:orexin receptor type 2-like [Mytilus californianus]|uniref:orexin receptor type 2-like n=1 Tax=Mytilus californianus TaxID=6549 RepID=UPI0022478CEE|nr:orexin receptor type 2-like [Mytilus californianus]
MNKNVTMENQSNCTAEIIPQTGSDFENIGVMCMLSVFSVMGTFGNGLVIYVYSKKRDKLTSNVFIMGLALTDFITSLLIMPYTVVFTFLEEKVLFDIPCKIFYFLVTSNVPLSAFIMVAIAVDRYLCICHPFLHLLTVPRAKIVLLIQLVFAGILGLITALMHSVYALPEELLDLELEIPYQKNISFAGCETVYTGTCKPTSRLFSVEFTLYYQKVYSSFFLISLLLVFTLYIMIYKYVTSRRAKRQKQKNAKQFSTTMVQTEASQIDNTKDSHDHLHPTKVEVNENGVSTTLLPPDHQDEQMRQQRKSVREKRDHNALANIKTAVMLFVVAVVFVIAYLPPWLMALMVVQYIKFVFYSYFVYNVVNPFIYAFMNPTFRTDLKKVFGKCLTKK